MIFRRAVLIAQAPLAVMLPVWVFISRGIVADGIGLQSVVYIFACPLMFVILAIVTALTWARKLVRLDRAVSWTDTALLSALWAVLIVYGFFAETIIAALAVVLLLLAFWYFVFELITETRARLKSFTMGLEASRKPGDAGPIIVVPDPKARPQ
jgi:hypothetical protein